MTGSASNRKAGLKVSGLVASGRVQLREVPPETGSPTHTGSDADTGLPTDHSPGPAPEAAAPSLADAPQPSPPQVAEAGFTPAAPANDTSAEGAPAAGAPAEDAPAADAPADLSIGGIVAAARKARRGAAKLIRVALVVDSPYQPRLHYNPEEIDELAETMREAKQGEPIRVRLKNRRYELISGHRRIRAARILGWTRILAYVDVMSDAEAQAKTMILAVGNVKLTDYELAKMFESAVASKVCKNQRAVASYFGFGTTKVNGCLDMLKLPRSIVRVLDVRPDLFGYETAIVIKKLLAEYPDNLADIERGVQRLVDGATQSSLKAWVLQAIKGQTNSTGAEPNLITRGRKLVFTTKVHADKRAILVNCKLPDMDVVEFEKELQAWLDERAKVLSPDLPDDAAADPTVIAQ